MSVKVRVVKHWSSIPEEQMDRWERDHIGTYIGKVGIVRFEDDDPIHPVFVDFDKKDHPAGAMRFNRSEVELL